MTTKQKVCFLLNNNAARDYRVERQASALASAGYDVTIFALVDETLPVHEDRNGFHIHRIMGSPIPNLYPKHGLVLKYAYELFRSQKGFHFVQAHDANTLLLGVILSKLWRAPLIYDSHEWWQSIYWDNLRKFNKKLKVTRDEINRLEAKPLESVPMFRFERKNHKYFFFIRNFRICVLKHENGHYRIQSLYSVKYTKEHRRLIKKVSTHREKIKELVQIKQLETKLITHASGIITVNQSLLNFILRHKNKSTPSSTLIRNTPFYFDVDPSSTDLFHAHFSLPQEFKVLLYQGIITELRGIFEFIEIVRHLKGHSIALVLMGPISPGDKVRFETTVAELQQEGCHIYYKEPVIGEKKLLQWSASADFGLVPIQSKRRTYYYCLPNKLFEYIQAETPVLSSDLPEVRQVIENYNMGLALDFSSIEKTAESCIAVCEHEELYTLFKQNVRKAKQELCWENEQKKLLALYDEIAATRYANTPSSSRTESYASSSAGLTT